MVKVSIKKTSTKPEDDILSKLSSLKMSVGSSAIIYARESDRMKHSLDDQVQKARKYAKDNGFNVESVIRETRSGEDIVKQTQLMNALLENRDTHFIFSHTDRITRDFQGFCSHFINCCNANRHTIHIVNEELVSSIPLHFKKENNQPSHQIIRRFQKEKRYLQAIYPQIWEDVCSRQRRKNHESGSTRGRSRYDSISKFDVFRRDL